MSTRFLAIRLANPGANVTFTAAPDEADLLRAGIQEWNSLQATDYELVRISDHEYQIQSAGSASIGDSATDATLQADHA